jgi:hypothetical protein
VTSLVPVDFSKVALSPGSRAWVSVATILCGVIGVVLVLLPDRRGLFPGLVLFIPAAVITSTCFRMRLGVDDDVITIGNGFRTRHVRSSAVVGMKNRVGPNLGITSLAWYWAFRRRLWWLVLSDGSTVRVAVFTEMRRDGTWRPVGTASADEWWAAFSLSSAA